MSKQQEGDLVTVTVTGQISQVTPSGYMVTIHGVDVPFIWINRGAPVPQQEELAQKILEMIYAPTDKDVSSSKDDLLYAKCTVIEDIKELCQEELSEQRATTTANPKEDTATKPT